MLPWLLGAAAVAVAAAILSDDDDDKKSSYQDDTEDEDEARRRAAQQRKRVAQKELSKEVNDYCVQKKDALVKALNPYFVCQLEPITIDLKKEIQPKISNSSPGGLMGVSISHLFDTSSTDSMDMNFFHFNERDKHEAIEKVINNIAYMQTRYETNFYPTMHLRKAVTTITRLDDQLEQLAILKEKVNELLTQIEE